MTLHKTDAPNYVNALINTHAYSILRVIEGKTAVDFDHPLEEEPLYTFEEKLPYASDIIKQQFIDAFARELFEGIYPLTRETIIGDDRALAKLYVTQNYESRMGIEEFPC